GAGGVSAGSTGGGASTSNASTSAASTGGAGGNACDADGDHIESKACGGTDCDDGNPLVHPGQSAFFDMPYGAGSYDYDCSGSEEFETPSVNCAALAVLNCNGQGFSAAVPCGQMGTLGQCVANITCGFQASSQQKQRCH